MGGLSRLQKRILSFVLREKFATSEEILIDLWGWPVREIGRKKPIVDKARYAAAHASLSRSLTRLWARGLIEYWRTLSHYRTAVSLTPAGKELVQVMLGEDQEGGSDG
jgi:hypothetical protein